MWGGRIPLRQGADGGRCDYVVEASKGFQVAGVGGAMIASMQGVTLPAFGWGPHADTDLHRCTPDDPVRLIERLKIR